MNSINLFKLKMLISLVFITSQINAQLSDLHYLPPLKQVSASTFTDQALYISTPEETAFDINIYQGTNTTPIATVNVSNDTPFVYTLPDQNNNITMVDNANTGVILSNSGLRLESVDGQSFYVNFRGNNNAQGGSLTSKGRTALGTSFKWGSIPSVNSGNFSENHNATLGIMATEDDTTITISDYDPDCTFRLGNDGGGITDDEITITLDANQTFVLEAWVGDSIVNRTGTIGASIESNKNIVISSGNIMLGLIQNRNNQDAGIDQSVPIDRLGRDYIFMRGNGSDVLEFPVIIATQNATNIFINDETTPIATLNEGEFLSIPGSNYSGDSAGDNLFVRASKNVYAYQLTAGEDAFPNLSINFISPVNCLMPQEVNNIANIQSLPSRTVTGGVTLLASTSTPDENIIITDNSGIVTLPESKSVIGSEDWKTFYVPNLMGNVSVQSSGPISVGYVGFNGTIGTSSYFSGFDTVPQVEYEFGVNGCLGDTITVLNSFDTYQWYENDELLDGETSSSYTPTGIGEVYVEVSSGGCFFNSNSIPVYYCEPEIVVNKTVDIVNVELGDTVNFTISVQSLGIEDVTSLNIEDQLPEQLTFVDAIPTKGTWESPNWTIGTMTAGELQSIIITATVTSLPTGDSNAVTNIAVNTQDQTDNNIEEDNASVSITIGNDTDNDGIDNTIDEDDDNDGILDVDETNEDTDLDGITNDLDLDSDNDGIPDIIEAGGVDINNDGRVDYPEEGNPLSMIDENANGVDDGIEANPLPDSDFDADGINNRIDIDADNDGLTDAFEAGGEDANLDGQIDNNTDVDLDGFADALEITPLPLPNSDDNENDNSDYIDIDADDDGLTDNVEAQLTFEYIQPSFVYNANGIDAIYNSGLEAVDTDEDGIPDYLDTDSDNDEILDIEELGIGTFTQIDTDGDGLDDGFEGEEINDPTDVNDEIEDPSTLPDTQSPGNDVDFRDNPNIEIPDNEDDLDIIINNETVGPNIDEGFFRIINIDLFPENTFKVFNRWGVLVFETSNYTNGSNDFRGVSEGRVTIQKNSNLPAGVYFYLLEYNKENVLQTKKGYLYVVR